LLICSSCARQPLAERDPPGLANAPLPVLRRSELDRSRCSGLPGTSVMSQPPRSLSRSRTAPPSCSAISLCRRSHSCRRQGSAEDCAPSRGPPPTNLSLPGLFICPRFVPFRMRTEGIDLTVLRRDFLLQAGDLRNQALNRSGRGTGRAGNDTLRQQTTLSSTGQQGGPRGKSHSLLDLGCAGPRAAGKTSSAPQGAHSAAEQHLRAGPFCSPSSLPSVHPACLASAPPAPRRAPAQGKGPALACWGVPEV
jgi:hypothetical protein